MFFTKKMDIPDGGAVLKEGVIYTAVLIVLGDPFRVIVGSGFTHNRAIKNVIRNRETQLSKSREKPAL